MNTELIADGVASDLSRRGFITGVGFVGAAAAAALAMPGHAHADEAPAPASSDASPARIFDGQELAIGHIVHDPDNCAGCRQCEIVCSLSKWGKVNPELANIRINTDVLGGFISEAYACKQCAGAECMAVCPTGALHTDENTGARVIDPTVCVGCKTCMAACPCTPSRIHYNPELNICFKCDLCGGEPKCVAACPGETLKCSWLEEEADSNTIVTDSGITINLDVTGALMVTAPDSITISGMDVIKTSNSVSVVGNVASTYTQPFEAKIKVSYLDAEGQVLFFSERLVVEVEVNSNADFEDVFETSDPNAVATCSVEIMCGKIAG